MKNILYVEDNQDTAGAVKIILESAGFKVDLAYSGEEGLNKIVAGKYQLVLLDIMLPDMSGWDVFSKAKRKVNSKFAFLSVIPVSTERMRELQKEGVSDYITKPFKKEDLIARVKKIVE